MTSFDKGINGFTRLMLQLMAVMVPLVFLINGFTKHDWKGAFFFALAVAVGLTPEMLPMIVSVCRRNDQREVVQKLVIDASGGVGRQAEDEARAEEGGEERKRRSRNRVPRQCRICYRQTKPSMSDGQ